MEKEYQIMFGSDDHKLFACLDISLEFSQLARYYLESANELIEKSVEVTSKLDDYIYSAVFLYRHSTELLLKELIWMSNDILSKGKNFPQDHNLDVLWQLLKKMLFHYCHLIFL